MLSWEREIVIRQQEIVAKLIQIRHEKQTRKLVLQQHLEYLDLSFFFSSGLLLLEEKLCADILPFLPGPDASQEGETTASEVRLSPAVCSIPELKVDLKEGEQSEPKSLPRLSPVTKIPSKDSTPLASPRRGSIQISSSTPKDKYSPRISAIAQPCSVGRRVSFGSETSLPDSDSPLEAARYFRSGMLKDSTSSSSETDSCMGDRFGEGGLESQILPESRVHLQTYNNMAELNKAYAAEQEQLRRKAFVPLRGLRHKQQKLRNELQVPKISMIFLKPS
eukprot:TRINITY_DN2732_c1_g1_i3.p1 TRINITY_DN2732_c1_g1~~TRINITY_DN2732_c1_g1_i3.p1  ORF type:complete len:278 (+),score=44.81 TRINITY_DN2732_c1_g1_i3:160-993(+)